MAGRLEAAYVKLDRLDEAYDQAMMKVTRLRHSIAVATAALDSSERRLSSDTIHLRTVAIDAYVTSATSTGLAMLLDSSRSELPEREAYLSAASGALSESISAVRVDRHRLSERQARLVASERAARAAARQIGRDRDEAASTTAALEGTLSQVKGRLVGLVAGRESAADATAPRKAARRAPPAPRPPAPRPPPPVRGGGAGAIAVRAAESQLGVPYVWGGATPGVGFDCSGLTMWAWRQAGVSLGHGATDQYYEIRHVPMSDLRPGDLIFYGSSGYLYHVVMYVGSGPYGRDTVIQAEHAGTDVMFTPLYAGYFGAGQP